MSFVNVLDGDVITRIISQCDVPTVLRISQTCRYLYNIAFTKTVWLALVAAVHRRVILDIPEDESFESLSTQSLVDLVKRAVRGPKAWTLPSQAPASGRRHVLNIPNSDGDAPKLLAGGRWLLLRRRGGLYCYHVPSSRLIWEYFPHGFVHQQSFHFRVHRVAEEVIAGGNAVMLMICLEKLVETESTLTIEFVHLNLLTGFSELFHSASPPNLPFAYEFFHPRIRGDEAAVGLRFGATILVINWRTGQQSELVMPLQTYDLELLPGYLYVIEGGQGSSSSLLHTYITNDIGRTKKPNRVRPKFHDSIALPTAQSPLQTLLSVKAHPLYDNTYIFWAFLTSAIPNFIGGPPASSAYKKYLVRLEPNDYAMKELSSVKIDKGFHDFGCSGASFAGHVMVSASVLPRRNVILQIDDIPKYADSINDLAAAPLPLARQITEYSGALLYLQSNDDTIVIEYYE